MLCMILVGDGDRIPFLSIAIKDLGNTSISEYNDTSISYLSFSLVLVSNRIEQLYHKLIHNYAVECPYQSQSKRLINCKFLLNC